MPTVEEVLALARQLSPAQQQEVARALARAGTSGGRPVHSAGGRSADLPIAGAPAPHSVAWVKAERGHAVLATDLTAFEAALPPGPAAIEGIWADRADLAPAEEQ
jgi:hypothetical protein